MEIHQELINKIISGQCVIFIGAGASIDAQAPSSSQLAKELNEQFLDRKYVNESLNKISSYMETMPGLGRATAIRYIIDKLSKLEPSEGHLLIPKFNWASIYTTNYDTLIEKAYSKFGINYKPIIFNSDLFINNNENKNENENQQLIYKPHGCISRPDSFILTEDDYYKCSENRTAIFRQLEIHKYRSTFLFVGYSFSDFNLSKIWFDIRKETGEFTQWSYALWPNHTKEQKYLWESRKVILIDEKFSDFMTELNKNISKSRVLKQKELENDDRNIKAPNKSSEVVKALLACLDMKDPICNRHSIFTAEVAKEISKELQLNNETQNDVEIAALLHDIGKIKIPDSILYKSGKLTLSELEIIKYHTILGEQIISSLSSIKHLSVVIRHHHERFDGRGYPDGIKDNEIPIEARIISPADIFVSLCVDRPYRKALGIEEVVKYIISNSGESFDPYVINAFNTLLKNGIIADLVCKHLECEHTSCLLI